MTPLLRSRLRDAHSWEAWLGAYKDAMPYVRDAFDEAVAIFETEVDKRVRKPLVTAVRELCEPDPTLRGHPLNRGSRGNQYSLERYVALFDLLARRVELGLADN